MPNLNDTDPNIVKVLSQPQHGKFPFPILQSETESVYLTWLRNHASYLTAGGFIGGLCAIAVYTRGVIGNLLMLLPVLIPSGFLLGSCHYFLLANPLFLTRWVLLFAVLQLLGYFAARAGNPRDQVNKSRKWMTANLPGIIVAALVATFTIEASPLVLDFFRRQSPFESFGLAECLSLIFAIAGASGTVVKLLPKSRELRLSIGSVTLALLSFILLWLVILRFANYQCYGVPPSGWQLQIPIYCAFTLIVAMVVAILNIYEWTWGPRILVASLTVVAAYPVFWGATSMSLWLREQSNDAAESMGDVNRPIARLINGLSAVHFAFPTESEALVSKLIAEKAALDRSADLYVSPSTGSDENERGPSSRRILHRMWSYVDSRWRAETTLNPLYYLEAQHFLERAENLVRSNPVSVQTLRQRLASVAFERVIKEREPSHEKLLQQLKARFVTSVVEKSLMKTSDVESILKMSESERDEWAEHRLPVAELESQLSKQRVPGSVQSNLQLAFPHREFKRSEESASTRPDAALTGELLFAEPIDRESIVELRRIAVLRHFVNLSKRDTTDLLAVIASNQYSLDLRSIDNARRVSTLPQLQELVERALSKEEAFDITGVTSKSLSIAKNLGNSEAKLPEFDLRMDNLDSSLAKATLVEIALSENHPFRMPAHFVLGELYDPHSPHPRTLPGSTAEQEMLASAIYQRTPATNFDDTLLASILADRLIPITKDNADKLIRRMVHGSHGNLDRLNLTSYELFRSTWAPRAAILGVIWLSVLLFCIAFVNPNFTSVHGFYRDRLADAFLLTSTQHGKVQPDREVQLSTLCNYDDDRCTAPYHLINTALNMQRSSDQSIRDRNADFVFFSRLFVGGRYVNFIRTEVLEAAAPDLTAASAMAISAGAAAPNMGKYTSRLLAFLLAVINVRLGHWIPNPRRLAKKFNSVYASNTLVGVETFETVYYFEVLEIKKRRSNAKDGRQDLQITPALEQEVVQTALPTVKHELVGVALSGGGIRSASVNLGMLQVLDQIGILPTVDYLSTVSGGGYLGTAISTFMRTNRLSNADTEATERAKPEMTVKPWMRLRWRPRFPLFYREMTSWLNSETDWINVSDGGHIENLGVYELLRRRCSLIIAGDGEEDAKGGFPGLSCLVRLASIDLGIKIEFESGDLKKLNELGDDGKKQTPESLSHSSVAKIVYPPRAECGESEPEYGYLLYIRSSIGTIDDVVINGYRKINPSFPHQPTVDQSFDEVQFEAYRRLGEEMTRRTLCGLVGEQQFDQRSFDYKLLHKSLCRLAGEDCGPGVS